MEQDDPSAVVAPTASDFAGSPFRLLPRVGNKLYRPSRMAAGHVQPAPRRVADMTGCSGPAIWDWG